ncbi:hypothetical protein Q1695_010147 [Nippostrongylus brasiliensis]|nr:hypothetical protein Q1695_010147 [Nippostrongylus brasiliensis]
MTVGGRTNLQKETSLWSTNAYGLFSTGSGSQQSVSQCVEAKGVQVDKRDSTKEARDAASKPPEAASSTSSDDGKKTDSLPSQSDTFDGQVPGIAAVAKEDSKKEDHDAAIEPTKSPKTDSSTSSEEDSRTDNKTASDADSKEDNKTDHHETVSDADEKEDDENSHATSHDDVSTKVSDPEEENKTDSPDSNRDEQNNTTVHKNRYKSLSGDAKQRSPTRLMTAADSTETRIQDGKPIGDGTNSTTNQETDDTFKESEQDVKESIMNWIIDCKASPKQTAQILKDIRKKVKSGDTGAAGSAFITAIAVLAAALVFNSW